MPRSSTPLRRPGARVRRLAPLSLAAVLALMAPAAALAQPAPGAPSAEAAVRDYALPAGPLATTLNRIAREAGLTLSFDAAAIGPLNAAPVQDRLTARQALAQALTGSGYELVTTEVGSFTLRRLPAPAATAASAASRAPAAESVLPVVRVSAASETLERPGRFARRGDPAPVEPGVVSAATLERYAADDLEDVFGSQPEVVVGGGHAIAQKIYLRGLEDTLLNVTIDGAAQPGQTFHHTGRVQIEPELLKQVEVLAGTGDATAGPGALGGALRFVTKDPSDLLRPGERAGALVKAGYFSNGEGVKAHTSVFGRLGDTWSALASLTHQDQGDYDDGAGRRVASTGARQQLGFLKLVGQWSGGHALRLSYDANRDDGERTQRPQWVTSSFNRAYPLESRRRGLTLGYDWQPGSELIDLKLSAFDTRQDLEQNVIGRWGLYFGRVDSTGLDLRNTSRVGVHRITYGVDHRRDRISSGDASNPSALRERGSISGVYVQDQIRLSPQWQLDLGARYDRYRLTDVNGLAQADDGISPNATLRWQALPELTLLTGHARALRGPKVRDAFKQDAIAPTAPGLSAERAATSELGAEFQPGAWRFNARVYRTTVNDAIADPIGRPTQYENVGRLQSRGVLLHVAHAWQRVTLGAGWHHNRATLNGQRLNGYEHNGLGTSQGDTLTTSLEWRAAERLDIGWTGRFVRAIDALQTSVGTVRKPGYGVHDLQASWRPQAVRGMTLSLAVKNLFDKDYLDHGSNEDFQHIPDYKGIVGSREPGRELRLTVGMRF